MKEEYGAVAGNLTRGTLNKYTYDRKQPLHKPAGKW